MRTLPIIVAGISILATACASSPKQVSATTPPPAESSKPAAAPTTDPAAKPPAGLAGEEKNKYACTRGSELRSIRIESLQPKGCKVWYSIIGKESPVAWSVNGKTHCETVSSKMVGNLESAGYKCALGENRAAASSANATASAAPAAPAKAAAPAPAK